MPTQEMDFQKDLWRQLDNLHLHGTQFALWFGKGCVDEQG
jgi:hypothetical protein